MLIAWKIDLYRIWGVGSGPFITKDKIHASRIPPQFGNTPNTKKNNNQEKSFIFYQQ
jgi:hypothetical protein